MAVPKRTFKVPLLDQPLKSVTVEDGATKGAVLGVNLYDQDGNLVTAASIGASSGTTKVYPTTIVAAVWGGITGDLNDQLDLKAQQNAQDAALAAEAATRAADDVTLAAAIATEASARAAADTAESAARIAGDAASVATAAADATTKANAAQAAAQTYADGKVIDSIADADTTHAPSRNAVFDALALKQDVIPWIQAGGTANAITATFAPAIAGYVDSMLLRVRPVSDNTNTTPTINANGLGAVTIKKNGGDALAPGDIQAFRDMWLVYYDNFALQWFELLNPATLDDAHTGVAGGTADALTVTLSQFTLGNNAYAIVRAGAANATTTPTLNVNGGGAVTITKFGGQALAPGDIRASGHECIFRYNATTTKWELLNPYIVAGGGGGSVDTLVKSYAQTAHGLVIGQPVYWNGTLWVIADADSDTTAARGFVSGVTAGPTADPYYSSATVILGFEGANGATSTTDAAGTPNTFVFNGAAAISTSWFRAGASSLALLSGTSFIDCPNTGAMNDFGSGDFTVECAFRPTAISANQRIFGFTDNTGNDELNVVMDATGKLSFLFYHSGSYKVNVQSTLTIANNTDYDLMIRRTGNVHELLINGTVWATQTTSHTQPTNSSRRLYIGRLGSSSGTEFRGYIDQFRVTKGVARTYAALTTAFLGSGASNELTVTLMQGRVTATAAEWLARVEAGVNLIPGETYWLSTTAGKITSTQPTSGYSQELGYAESTTVFVVSVGPVVALAGGTAGYTVPLASAFTLTGSGITATDKIDRLQLLVNTFNTTFRGMMRSVPTTPYTIDIGLELTGVVDSGTSMFAGLALSNGTAYRTLSIALTGGVGGPRVFAWTTNAAVATVPYSANYAAPLWPKAFLRITDDGTTRKFYISQNGKDFSQVLSEANTTGLTATQCGIVVYNDSVSNGRETKASVFHYLVSSGVSGDAS